MKFKELYVKAFLEEQYGDIFIHNRTFGKTQYRPDFRFETNQRIILVEVDEHQHKTYLSDEEERQQALFRQSQRKHVVVIRFNPDSYINEYGERVKGCFTKTETNYYVSHKEFREWSKRLNVLKTTIDTQLNGMECSLKTFQIKLFYDIPLTERKETPSKETPAPIPSKETLQKCEAIKLLKLILTNEEKNTLIANGNVVVEVKDILERSLPYIKNTTDFEFITLKRVFGLQNRDYASIKVLEKKHLPFIRNLLITAFGGGCFETECEGNKHKGNNYRKGYTKRINLTETMKGMLINDIRYTK